jgi:hypothetical protein
MATRLAFMRARLEQSREFVAAGRHRQGSRQSAGRYGLSDLQRCRDRALDAASQQATDDDAERKRKCRHRQQQNAAPRLGVQQSGECARGLRIAGLHELARRGGHACGPRRALLPGAQSGLFLTARAHESDRVRAEGGPFPQRRLQAFKQRGIDCAGRALGGNVHGDLRLQPRHVGHGVVEILRRSRQCDILHRAVDAHRTGVDAQALALGEQRRVDERIDGCCRVARLLPGDGGHGCEKNGHHREAKGHASLEGQVSQIHARHVEDREGSEPPGHALISDALPTGLSAICA